MSPTRYVTQPMTIDPETRDLVQDLIDAREFSSYVRDLIRKDHGLDVLGVIGGEPGSLHDQYRQKIENDKLVRQAKAGQEA